jgi:hypothetical protein
MGTHGADGASGATGYTKDQRVLWPVFVSLGKGKARREKELAVQVVECIGERYELQDAEMGIVYKWCPAIVTVECGCGERLTLTPSRTTCARCGADHTHVFAEVLGIGMEDEGHSPWRSLRSYFTHPKTI